MKKSFLFPFIGLACLCLGMVPHQVAEPWRLQSSMQEILVEEGNVQLLIKPLTPEESEKYLQRNILKMGYQPIYVTVENGSSDPYTFSPESIGLPLVEVKKIAKKILTDGIPRAIGFKVASLFFWPLTIPGTVDSLLTHKSYRKLKKRLEAKAVRPEVIPPYATVHRLFFIPKEENKGSFDVTLENQETLESKVFHIEDFSTQDLQTVEALPTVAENYYLTHEQ